MTVESSRPLQSPSQGRTQPGVAAGCQARPGARPPPSATWPRSAVLRVCPEDRARSRRAAVSEGAAPLAQPPPQPRSSLRAAGRRRLGPAWPRPCSAGQRRRPGGKTSPPAPPSVHGRPAPLEAAFRAGRLGRSDGGARGVTAAGGPKSMEPRQGRGNRLYTRGSVRDPAHCPS